MKVLIQSYMDFISKIQQNMTFRRLGDNFISLFILQFINYILPLFLIPYLIYIIGMENFGIYSFIFAIMTYGLKVSDYGFDLSATYHVSIHKNNVTKIHEIFSSVIIIKSLLAILFLLLLTLAIFTVDKLYLYKELLFLSYGIVLGNIFLPLWFFQGIEKMRYIMYLNGFLKLSFFLLVLIFVQKESDIKVLLFLHSLTSIIVGISGLYIAVKFFKIKLSIVPLVTLYFYIKDGWYIFTSKIAVEFYSTSSTIMVGLFVSPILLAYYVLSIKIIAAIGNLFDPIIRTVYPYLVNIYQTSNENFITKNKQLSIVILIIMIPISLLIFTFSEFILELITQKEVAPLNIYLLQTASFLLLVFPFGGQFTNILVTIKETKLLNLILISAGVMNVLFAPILLHFFSVIGMIWLNIFIAYFLILTKALFIYKLVYKNKKG